MFTKKWIKNQMIIKAEVCIFDVFKHYESNKFN